VGAEGLIAGSAGGLFTRWWLDCRRASQRIDDAPLSIRREIARLFSGVLHFAHHCWAGV